MKTEELLISSVVSASPNQIYAALLDERQHTAFVGARATVEPWVGGRLTAWDGYATALIAGLDTGKRILLSWRTADFPPSLPDSHVEIRLESIAGGTKVEIRQKGIPAGQTQQYKEAWKKHYLDSMRKMFAKPDAMRNAIREASKAGRLPIPGVTAARPGTVRPFTVRDPNAVAPAVAAGRSSRDGDDDDDDSSEDRDERVRRYSSSDDYDDDRPMRRSVERDDLPKRPAKPVPLPGAMLRAATEAQAPKGKRPAYQFLMQGKSKGKGAPVSPGKAAPSAKVAAKPASKSAPAKAATKVTAKPAPKKAAAPAKAKPVKVAKKAAKPAKVAKKAAKKPAPKKPVAKKKPAPKKPASKAKPAKTKAKAAKKPAAKSKKPVRKK
jgi:uncharacterized protein YndB with AHSA1/START domain